jgi:energy coupling factor transporter S component ThiW
MGTGTLLAFPGSMVGALCSGLMFHYTKKYIPTYLSEVIGGGVLGGLMAYPVAAMLLGRQSAFYAYVIPFLTSEAGGVIIAACFIGVLKRTKALDYMRQILQ